MADLPIPQRIRALLDRLNHQMYEKEYIVSMVLLSALAGESIFLLGPPGVAKSMMARRLKHVFKNAKTFEYLMGKFSTPDEIFGPVSISKLKDEDKYERMTKNYLPGSNIVFLDEIWKASPPIQNALLTVLNEKIFRNGEKEIKVDLRALISASNELPLKGEGLEALWDRFLIRILVENIEGDQGFEEMIGLPGGQSEEELVPEDIQISPKEYNLWREQIDNVKLPPHILGLMTFLRNSIRQRNSTLEPEEAIYVSDRRWRKIVQLLRASAFLNGRDEVHVMDVFLASDCIWSQLEHKEESHALVLGAITGAGYRKLVNVQPIRDEMNILRKEIDEAIHVKHIDKVEEARTFKDEKGTSFVKAQRFWGDSDAFIQKEKWHELTEGNEEMTYMPIFEKNEGHYRPFQTMGVKKKGAFLIENKGKEYKIEAEWVDKERIEKQAPSDGLIKIWNSQIKLLLEICEEGIKSIEKRQDLDEPHLKTHLFVPKEHAEHVAASLTSTTNDLLNLKLEVQKTRYMYESITQGTAGAS
ncbi:MAG: AAA family ATPase [Bacteroidia bacterium]|nr:AAA family ATPase [Bacteroidia bacterium]